MKNVLLPKKWLISFLCIFLSAVFLVGIIAYLVDPFYQFRYDDPTYFNNTAKFPGPGLVKNYDYDTLIIGSSMTQNFDMDLFRRELGVSPLHIGIGGMGIDELLAYIELSEQTGKCEDYYIGIDQYMLTEAVEYRTPEYLFNDDPVSMLRYLFCYEAWFRYIPMDVAISALDHISIDLPLKIRQAADIDYLANWENDFPFGEDVVIQNYLRDDYGVSSVETEGLYSRMMGWTDKLFENLPGDRSQYHFFFPPYSVLFWYDARNDGYFETYLEAKKYFVEKAREYGVDVYDFQSASFISDLNNYKDTTHYCGQINDWMVSCFAEGEYLADMESVERSNAKLVAEVENFASGYEEFLKERLDKN